MGIDDTGRKPKRAQTQTERDMAGLAELRERKARGDAIVRAAADDAIPAPFEGVDTGITERIQEDEDLARIYAKVAKSTAAAQTREAQMRKEFANLVLEVAGERPPAERFAGLEKKVKFWHWVISALVIPTVAALVLSIKYVYTRGVTDTRIEIEHKQVLQDIATLKSSRDELARQLEAAQEVARQNATRIDDLFRELSTARRIDTSRTAHRAPSPQPPPPDKVSP